MERIHILALEISLVKNLTGYKHCSRPIPFFFTAHFVSFCRFWLYGLCCVAACESLCGWKDQNLRGGGKGRGGGAGCAAGYGDFI